MIKSGWVHKPTVKPKLEIESKRLDLFPTPFIQAKTAAPKELNEALMTAIKAERERSKGINRSNVGGWHSDTDMLKWGGPAAATLAETAIAMAKNVSHFEGRDPERVKWQVSMWANVSPPGAVNMSHVHASVLWAAVYYVDMGSEPGKAQGGELCIEDPRFPLAYMTTAGFREIKRTGIPQGSEARMKMEAGDLVLFPGYLRHSVRPHAGPRDRVSIAMNIQAR